MIAGYTLAWLAYIAGALALLLTGWRITRSMKREWRHLFLATVGALLLTPGVIWIEQQGSVWAPALFILVLDGLFETGEMASQAGLTLLGVWLVALVLSLIFQLVVRPKSGKLPSR